MFIIRKINLDFLIQQHMTLAVLLQISISQSEMRIAAQAEIQSQSISLGK
jgi:hypothetical protein